MSKLTMPNTPGSFGSLGVTFLAVCLNAGATVIQSTPTLPPTTGSYGLHATICLLAACITEADIGKLMPTSSQFENGNQQITATGVLFANAFQNNGGVPGAPIGKFTMSGTLSITYLGRNSDTQLGTFQSLLTSFDFSGSFNSHTLDTRLNTSQGGNSGSTTVSAFGDKFQVDSFFDVFAELSLDHGPFVAGPERHLTLESNVPEPGSAGMALLGFVTLAAVRQFRRRASRNG
jgi:MYXO-CTERM domain-containing protein